MKWLRSAVLLTVLAPLVGCSLYFDDQGSGDDTHCTSTLPLGVAAQQLRNPETGACQSFPYNEDPCGVAETNSRVATPNWPACSGACEGLDQVTCSTTSGCHAYFNDGEYDDAANPASGSFLACGEVGTPTPVAQTDCTTLDANACANADWCESIVQPAAVGEVNANVFAYCAPISPSTTASCTTDSDCPVGDSCVAVPTPTICDLNGCTPQQYQCQATTTPPTCYTDADCASGSQCEFTNFDCNGPGSQTGETECPGQCVVVTPPPSQCYQDSDCPTGDTCQLSNAASSERACSVRRRRHPRSIVTRKSSATSRRRRARLANSRRSSTAVTTDSASPPTNVLMRRRAAYRCPTKHPAKRALIARRSSAAKVAPAIPPAKSAIAR